MTFHTEPQDDNDTAESIATNLNHVENSSLLQTAIAVASNLSNTKSDNSAILFDTGSQRSFISTELREKLKLPTIRKESFYIKVFGKSVFFTNKFIMEMLKLRYVKYERNIG